MLQYNLTQNCKSSHANSKTIWIISDEDQHALVVTFLLQKHGLAAQWVSSKNLQDNVSKMNKCLVIYDIVQSAAFTNQDHYLSYYEKIVEVPKSALLVGLGDLFNIPKNCDDLCTRTATFIGNPFNIQDVINILRVFRL